MLKTQGEGVRFVNHLLHGKMMQATGFLKACPEKNEWWWKMKMFVVFIGNFFRCFRHVWFLMLVLFALIFLGAVALTGVEGFDIGSAIYFAIVTSLTIGYGDITPATPLGKLISVLIAVVGVVAIGLVIGVSTRALMLSMHPEDRM